MESDAGAVERQSAKATPEMDKPSTNQPRINESEVAMGTHSFIRGPIRGWPGWQRDSDMLLISGIDAGFLVIVNRWRAKNMSCEPLRNIEAKKPHEEDFLQLADIVIGAVAYTWNDRSTGEAKQELQSSARS
jgi:hypothetical protein